MADWRQASEHYLALHQIGQIWERITHSLVTLRPPDVMEHTIQKLEKLKTQKDVPGRRLVFLVGGPGSKAKEVAESLSSDCGTVAIDGGAVIAAASDPASAEKVALSLRKELLTHESNQVYIVHGYPKTISQALLTEIQVTPASVCVYLDTPDEAQAEACGQTLEEVQAAMQKDVYPVLEYFRAKESLVSIDASAEGWRSELVSDVQRQRELLAADSKRDAV